MFGLFNKKKQTILYAPVDGTTIPLSEVTDDVFSQKMLGDGIAFAITGNEVCAPCDGTVTMIADTMHAFGMEAENGAEILIHIGMDTVELKGNGFTRLVSEHTKVKKGTPVIRLDLTTLEKSGYDLSVPMVITNSDDFTFTVDSSKSRVRCGEDSVIFFE